MRAARRRARGFTLLELLAVIAILALVAALTLPNIASQSHRLVRAEAERLAADLELARQRSVVTGVPHRVQLDLERGLWWTEWQVSEARASGTPRPADPQGPPPGTPGVPLRADTPLDLKPPAPSGRDWYAIGAATGRRTRLNDSVFFEGVETPDGLLDRGTVTVVFAEDGTATPGTIALATHDEDLLLLEVGILSDAVRIHDGTDG